MSKLFSLRPKTKACYAASMFFLWLLIHCSDILYAQTYRSSQEENKTNSDSLHRARYNEHHNIDSIAKDGWISGGIIGGFGSLLSEVKGVENQFTIYVTQHWRRFGIGIRGRVIGKDKWVDPRDGDLSLIERYDPILLQVGPSFTFQRAALSSFLPSMSSLTLTPSFCYIHDNSSFSSGSFLTWRDSNSLYGVSIMSDFDVLLLLTQVIGVGLNLNGSITSFWSFNYGVGLSLSFGNFPWARDR